jgi:hypothetical protein
MKDGEVVKLPRTSNALAQVRTEEAGREITNRLK